MPPKETVKISQDTFDDAVKDNMEVFDMPFEEAIKSAIEEFQLQVSSHCRKHTLPQTHKNQLITISFSERWPLDHNS